MGANLYVHFPFCRSKCSYCALHSRAGQGLERRRDYVNDLVRSLLSEDLSNETWRTIYFGGGSPALCDLRPLFEALRPMLSVRSALSTEFTVELHPLDVTDDLLKTLKAGGVNRISMGVQSLDDAVLTAMGRGYTFAEVERAFALVKKYFDNAGIDLIVGYPGETSALTPQHARLAKWGLRHCSVYSLILEEKTMLALQVARQQVTLDDDDMVMNRLKAVAAFLKDIGLERYEISNYAAPGYECRHNLAVWRGEDYVGLGEGAHGRIGLGRTQNGQVVETVTPETDAKERRLFRLRTREGLDAIGYPEWLPALDKFAAEGLLAKSGLVYRLTERGTEVCDSILAEII